MPLDRRPPALVIAANQGEIGGGEVMLLEMAEAAIRAGIPTRVIAPAGSALAQRARADGIRVIGLGEVGGTRAGYLAGLRRWDRERRQDGELLWCNGLGPALATAGRPDRVVHLHQSPRGGTQAAVAQVARAGALETVVPSVSMATTVAGATILPNWTGTRPPAHQSSAVSEDRAPTPADGPATLGYLGRLSSEKGVAVLAAAVARLARQGRPLRLVVAGDSRFVPAPDRAVVEEALAGLGPLVERPGWVDRNDFFDRVDLAVFPSIWPEPFGLVVAEAMGSGVPFVISDAGALPEVAGPDHPWVSRAGDPVHLAQTIAHALDDPRPLHTIAAGRQLWEARYSPEAGGARFLELLGRVGRPRGRSGRSGRLGRPRGPLGAAGN